jgi:hypothetical protein
MILWHTSLHYRNHHPTDGHTAHKITVNKILYITKNSNKGCHYIPLSTQRGFLTYFNWFKPAPLSIHNLFQLYYLLRLNSYNSYKFLYDTTITIYTQHMWSSSFVALAMPFDDSQLWLKHAMSKLLLTPIKSVTLDRLLLLICVSQFRYRRLRT